MSTPRSLSQKYRAVLRCLGDQDDPRAPKCSGCMDQYLCKRVRGVLDSNYDAAVKVASTIQHAGIGK